MNRIKHFDVVGDYRILVCRVQVSDHSKQIQVHNPSTHDEDNRLVTRFNIWGYIDNKAFRNETDIKEEEVLARVEQMEKDLHQAAKEMTSDKMSLLEGKLKAMGYI